MTFQHQINFSKVRGSRIRIVMVVRMEKKVMGSYIFSIKIHPQKARSGKI